MLSRMLRTDGVEIGTATVTLSGHRSQDPMGANDDGAWLSTLGLIGLYQSGVSVIVSLLREVGEDPDIVSAIAVGRLDRRGKLRGFITYRVHGDHIVAMVGKIRIEFNTAHPEGFSAY